MKKILLAMLMVALVAMPALASTQNVKVSGDIDSTFIFRDEFDLGFETNMGGEQSLFITQTRIAVSADLTDNVAASIRLINERPWGEDDGANTTTVNEDVIAIDQAFAQFREILYAPLTVTVGRQALRYGNALLIGDPNTNNQASTSSGISATAVDFSKEKSFDAIRGVLDYDPLTIDFFVAKIDSNLSTVGPGADDDVDLYGGNAHYNLGDSRNTEVETYFFARINKASEDTVAGTEPDSVYAPGLRASTNPIKGLNVQGEVAWQFGNKATTQTAGTDRADNQKREAMAAQVITSYAIDHEKVNKWKPVVASWYTFLSGDANPADRSNRASPAASGENYTAWDPMFEDQSGGTIYNTLFDYSNAHLAGGSLQVTPIEDVIAKFSFTGIWLHHEIDTPRGCDGVAGCNLTLRQPDGTTIVTTDITTNTHVGNELDVDFIYNYTEDVQFGASLGWFFPGKLFDRPVGSTEAEKHGNDDTAKQIIVNADIIF